MAGRPKATILDHFADLDDPRVERTRRHQLVDIIAIAIGATICGADSWVHAELFGKSKLEWFQTFLELPGGIPSHDTPAFAGAGSSAMSLPVWTQPNSRTALCPGPRPSRNCCPVRWSPLTARRPDGPTTGRGARGPCIWSAPGRRRTPPYQVRAGSDPGSGQD